MFCIILKILVKWRKNSYSTKIKTNEASDSIEDQLSEEKTTEPLPTEDISTKIDAVTDDNHRNIKQNNRKRKIKNVSEEEHTVQEKVVPKKQRKSEKRPDPSIRFDYSLGHFPRIDKDRTVRCKHKQNGCKQKTFIFCSVCKVHLCLCVVENRNCFTDFHIKKE